MPRVEEPPEASVEREDATFKSLPVSVDPALLVEIAKLRELNDALRLLVH